MAVVEDVSIKGETRFWGWLYIFPKHDLIFWREFEFIWPLICDTQALWQIGHFIGCCKKAARSSKFGVALNLMKTTHILQGYQQLICIMSWASKSNRKSTLERWASAHAQTFHDLINLDCPPICFYWTFKDNNWWWEYWSLAVPY